jgi:hypothetical protein
VLVRRALIIMGVLDGGPMFMAIPGRVFRNREAMCGARIVAKHESHGGCQGAN